MRVLIASNFFSTEFHYNEVILAKGFLRLGWKVTIVTGSKDTENQSKLSGEFDVASFNIINASRVINFGNSTIPIGEKFKKEVTNLRADLAILIAPQRGVGWAVARILPVKVPLISIFADLIANSNKNFFKSTILRFVYQSIFNKSHKILGVCEETLYLLKTWWGLDQRKETEMLALPFDEEIFTYRNDFSLSNIKEFSRGRFVFVTVTTIVPGKNIMPFLLSMAQALKSQPQFCFVLAGLPKTDYGDEIRSKLVRIFPSGQICFMNILNPTEIADLYNSADAAVWFQGSIGLQQSLACGLPVVHKALACWDHVVKTGFNSISYSDLEELEETLIAASQREWNKSEIAEDMRKFCSINTCKKILNILN